MKSYHPISPFSLVGKTQERIEILLDHLLERDAISDHKFGFRPRSSMQDHVPLSKRLTFAKGLSADKTKEKLKAKAAEMEQTVLKAVIDLVEVSKLVHLPELLEYCVVEECVAIFNSNGTYRKTQKSKLIQKFHLQSIDLQETYIALIVMGMVWRMATPSAVDRQRKDGQPYT